MIVLAIESSCDETSAAVIQDAENPRQRIVSNVINSQIETHKRYGGVIPEYAARRHMDYIDVVINEALRSANNLTIDDVDVIAATAGPGLIGGLLVGTVTAKTIALMKSKPFMAINHLEGHLLTVRLCCEVEFPYLVLLASGGHFVFAEALGVGDYRVLGETLDDAAGEAFDKVAKMLGLEYPGGPSIEKYAKKGDKNRFKYTMPMQRRDGCDASFSGIKTATKLHIEYISDINEQDRYDIAASFQNAVVNFIAKQTERAYAMTKTSPKNIVLSGGVAANLALREVLAIFATKIGANLFVPPVSLCSDNAAMIGWCAIERIRAGHGFSGLDFKTKPKWGLDEL
ncbi:MAG: tRNA (adenosine(37)-N6)-threonylcarbamoyltransferase complex transferase subunit TsaD [Holosporales bacterium]|jgi:N6-L-threonylcarbamoyladenine synthase|nr:tRNA (adenosine(37)-N6)-threonylcarbamoyltransferase complex transferase subunit TsaD [Holosporales bacterium]